MILSFSASRAVRMRTGMLTPFSRICLQTSKPFRPGSIRSSSTRSGLSSMIMFRPVIPS